MCGIAGVVDPSGRGVERALVERMASVLGHRGPDARGVYVDGPVGLAHARLAVVDLEGGAQPMTSDDGRVWLVFNGEIYDHVERRRELEDRGHRFRTRSDTEVLLRAWLEWGPGCLERLDGQWAFALWDGRDRTLHAARDRVGIRPLYFALDRGRLIFASEVKALFSDPAVPRALDPEGLAQIASYWSTVPPRTVFEGVRELPPGHRMTLREGELEVRPWFAIDWGRRPEPTDEEALVEELRAALVAATRLRFERSDVPVAAYLSGGLDSSLLTAMVHRFTDVPLSTLSVGFADRRFDESRHQQTVIEALGVKHHRLVCTEEEVARVMPQVVWHAEQPLFRTAPAPMFLLSRLARELGFAVVLTGEGADELLGGYDIYKEAKVRRFWAAHPESRLRPLLLRKLHPHVAGLAKQGDAYLRAFFHAEPEDLDDPLFSHLPRWQLGARIAPLFSAEIRDRLRGDDRHEQLRRDLPEGFSSWDPFRRAQHLESRYFLPGYILSAQGDRMAMAHGVEARYPFLSPALLSLAARIPPRLAMRALDEKHLLKRAARGLVPDSVRQRHKQPYRAPGAERFFDGEGRARAEWVDHVLSPSALERAGVFNPRAVDRLVQKARRGRVMGMRDSTALTLILTTQLVDQQLIQANGAMQP